jgi:hypothetical protein
VSDKKYLQHMVSLLSIGLSHHNTHQKRGIRTCEDSDIIAVERADEEEGCNDWEEDSLLNLFLPN